MFRHRVGSGLILPGALALAPLYARAAAQEVPFPPVLPSPKITGLLASIAHDRPAAVAQFWTDLKRDHTPIIEAYPPDSGYILVTFVFRDTVHAHSVLVSNGVAGWVEYFMRLEPIPETNIWYKTVVLPSDVNIGYQFRVDDLEIPLWAAPAGRFAKWHGDDLDPDVDSTTRVRGARSKFHGPRADPQPYVTRRAGTPRGRLDSMMIDSKILEQQRKVWFYAPPVSDAGAGSAALPLLVMFDGRAYTADAWVPTPTILDNLLAAKKIRPVAALFIDNGGNRMQELGCDSTFTAFVVDEVLPIIRRRYHVTADPRLTAIGGSSQGGLGAACAGLRYSKTFGNVISQSGSYWWAPPGEESEWPARAFASRPKLPVRFYVEVGTFEVDRIANDAPGQVDTNRHIRDVLRAKGYDVTYNEFPGAHEYYNWRGTLSAAIAHFFPPL
jgi:enterochelin esterase-like enzyme